SALHGGRQRRLSGGVDSMRPTRRGRPGGAVGGRRGLPATGPAALSAPSPRCRRRLSWPGTHPGDPPPDSPAPVPAPRSPMPTFEELDAITLADLQATGATKWSRGSDLIGAFVAEMDFGIAAPITRRRIARWTGQPSATCRAI